MNLYLSEIAELLDGVVTGDKTIQVSNLSPIDAILPGTLVYAEGRDNIKRAEASEAAALLVGTQVTSETKTLIQVAHPLKAFIFLLQHFNPPHTPKPGIHPTAIIEEGVTLGKNVSIGPYVHIESGTRIGDDCVLKSHVHIGRDVILGNHCLLFSQVNIYDNCLIGNNVRIHGSTVIGADGFGYTFQDGKHMKMPHVGRVIIEDDVEIGANTAIDRATLGATVIGKGTKIDNMVQIAHSVKLGQHNIVCGFTGIAGSTTTGDNVIIAAKVGIADHVRIDAGVIVLAGTNVSSKKHLVGGNMYLGTPARPRDKAMAQELAIARLHITNKNLKMLDEKVAALSEKLNHSEAE